MRPIPPIPKPSIFCAPVARGIQPHSGYFLTGYRSVPRSGTFRILRRNAPSCANDRNGKAVGGWTRRSFRLDEAARCDRRNRRAREYRRQRVLRMDRRNRAGEPGPCGRVVPSPACSREHGATDVLRVVAGTSRRAAPLHVEQVLWAWSRTPFLIHSILPLVRPFQPMEQ